MAASTPRAADNRSDHAEPALAQRSAKMRLANESRGCSGPVGIFELEPKRDVEGETDRGPQPEPEQQRRAGGPRRIGQSRPPNRQRPLIRSLPELIDGVGHRERDEGGSGGGF